MGVRGARLEETDLDRGMASSRTVVGDFELYGKAVIISSGGIGANIDLIKQMWPRERLGGKVPDTFVIGVPAHVDGRMLKIAEDQGARIVNRDRMWHYTGRSMPSRGLLTLTNSKKDFRTGVRFGQSMASACSRVHLPSGWTLPANAWRRHSTQAATPWPPFSGYCQRDMTTAGSF